MERRPRLRARLRSWHGPDGDRHADERALFLTVEPAEMTGMFAPPAWLRDLSRS